MRLPQGRCLHPAPCEGLRSAAHAGGYLGRSSELGLDAVWSCLGQKASESCDAVLSQRLVLLAVFSCAVETKDPVGRQLTGQCQDEIEAVVAVSALPPFLATWAFRPWSLPEVRCGSLGGFRRQDR